MWFLTKGRIYPWTWTDCKLGKFLFDFGRFYSSWILVIMSIEKVFVLYFPFKAKSICTTKTAKWTCLITACIFAGYDLQFFFIRKASTSKDGLPICISTNVPSGYYDNLPKIATILYSFAPFTIMIITNVAIIYKFLVAKWLVKRRGTESTSQALSKNSTRGTAMLITVSVMFMILTGPTAVSTVVKFDFHPIERAFINLLQYLNHSINGVLYCIVGTRFRNELLQVLCYRGNISGRTESGVSVSSSRN